MSPTRPRPEDTRQAMADFVTGLHQAYLAQAGLLPPAETARLPLLAAGAFTVVAAGAGNLHVLATTEALPPPQGQEVEVSGSAGPLTWRLRFFDPVVLPGLGLASSAAATAAGEVRRVLGVRTVLYHLMVQPGAELTGHHAMHMGTGLANAQAAAARDLDTLRAHAPRAIALVDELAGALQAGLPRAAALLAAAIAPDDETVGRLTGGPAPDPGGPAPDPAAVLRALIAAVRRERSRVGS